jgi:hypothetical protein
MATQSNYSDGHTVGCRGENEWSAPLDQDEGTGGIRGNRLACIHTSIIASVVIINPGKQLVRPDESLQKHFYRIGSLGKAMFATIVA